MNTILVILVFSCAMAFGYWHLAYIKNARSFLQSDEIQILLKHYELDRAIQNLKRSSLPKLADREKMCIYSMNIIVAICLYSLFVSVDGLQDINVLITIAISAWIRFLWYEKSLIYSVCDDNHTLINIAHELYQIELDYDPGIGNGEYIGQQ